MMRLVKYSYRFAEEILNSKFNLKQEIENTLKNLKPQLSHLSRPRFHEILKEKFTGLNWESKPNIFDNGIDAYAKLDFIKDRVGIKIEFGHSSFIGIDLLKFQVSSYSGFDKIDVGVYLVTTREFQQILKKEHGQKWTDSLHYEKVIKYLPHFKSAIQVPIYVIGIDL